MSENIPAGTPFPRSADEDTMRVWVVFSGASDLRWLSFLKAGFRHCFVITRVREGWILVDPLAHRTEISFIPAGHVASLPQFFEQQGCRAVELARGFLPVRPRVWPPMVFTCVEAVKRIIGLRRLSVLTPWQLYRALIRAQSPQPMKGK